MREKRSERTDRLAAETARLAMENGFKTQHLSPGQRAQIAGAARKVESETRERLSELEAKAVACWPTTLMRTTNSAAG